MLIGQATRVIVGRNALQTVYWRAVKNCGGTEPIRLVKYNRTCTFKGNQDKTSKLPAMVSDRYEH